MSTEATSNNRDAATPTTTPLQPPPVAKQAPTEQQHSQAGVPRRFAPGQTVCNVKNEKGKLCNGHLKQKQTGGEAAATHLRGDDVLSQCQSCGALYMGPPLGHLRDPDKQQRFIEKDLTAILRAAGGTLPFYPTTGGQPQPSAPASKAKPAAPPARAATTATPASSAAAPPPAAPVTDAPAETPAQKMRRLARVVAEAKQRAGKPLTPEQEELLREPATAPPPLVPKSPAAPRPPTPARVADSSATADAHRPAAEAQAATGQASAAPMSPAAATASPAAGAETVADLAPEASTELTPGAPRADVPQKQAAPAPTSSGGGHGIPPPPPHLAPPPGETHAEKIARLQLVVAEAKRRAGKE